MQSYTPKVHLLNTAIMSENKLAARIITQMQLLLKEIKVLSQRISGNNLYNTYKHCFRYIRAPISRKILSTKLGSIFAIPLRRIFWSNFAQLTVNSNSVFEFTNHRMCIYTQAYAIKYLHNVGTAL
jgi:hypothetical protein